MKDMNRFISFLFVAVLAIGTFSCQKDPEVNMERIRIHENEKQFSTDGPTISMNLSGSVSYSKAISKMTLCLGSAQDLSDAVCYDVTMHGTTFSVDVDNLKSDTIYYYRFYVYRYSVEFDKEMEIGGMQTNVVSTHNLCYVPSVETGKVSSITQTSAVVAGRVVNDGGMPVIERGICWSAENIPTIADNHISSEMNEPSFSLTITGLLAETTYYVRTYAINEVGVGYGIEKCFTTLAQFQVSTVSVSANPSNGGMVTGGGVYQQGQSCTVKATANAGYTFINWTENGNQVSTNVNYTFTVNSNRTLIAQFQAQPQAPTGAINGLFSVSATKKVYFSQGNLQYQASTHTWRHAENQWDYIGADNANISQTNSDWIDLFGWGTSGYNHGAVCYQPWSTSENDMNYYPYGSNSANLFDQTGQADWGYNAISNGGSIINSWRTLTKEEWSYVFFSRNTASGIHFAKAFVNGVNGVVLLPDSWSASTYALNFTNSIGADYCNTISAQDWTNTLQPAGAVFLPASGSRYGTYVYNEGSVGIYWSSSRISSSNAYRLLFNGTSSNGLSAIYSDDLYYGHSVRLVQDVE